MTAKYNFPFVIRSVQNCFPYLHKANQIIELKRMKDSKQEKDEHFIYTQQIATELHEKDDLIYRSPNKVLNPSTWD